MKAEAKQGFDFATGDFWRVPDEHDLWKVTEMIYKHEDRNLPENEGECMFNVV